ncbi:hypothetical protein BSL78_19815 [Apostichopus japonicus]|uniref:Uncharacterized protein n=1 Tax=Stichopus japonicus TaxID=307972 RepID=A0A2G8K5N8_STIJA|nr:hypothetical protein BSL78_19815 [Apostichopus japonicus]
MEVRKAFHYAYQVLTQAVVPHIDQESNGHRCLLLPDQLEIAQPIRPVNATTIILADSSQRNSQETGSCQEVNKKSAMNPTAATNMSNSNDVINNKVTSISSSSSGEIVSSSSDSSNNKCEFCVFGQEGNINDRNESEMSSHTFGSSKDTIDSVQGPSKREAVPSVGPETSTDKAWTQEIKKPVSHGQTYHKQSNSANGAIILLTLSVVTQGTP